jgi:acetyl esterase/lipase
MNARGTAVRLVVGLAVTFLLGGCAAGASVSPSATSVVTASPTMAVATPSPRPTPTVVVTTNVAYESSNPVLTPGMLDVYAPVRAGPWPVVVMLPPGDKSRFAEHARRVADLGFVVFSATWDITSSAGSAPTYDELLAAVSQAACAVEFARAKAAGYGGDPATLILFGHSAGAGIAGIVAFHRPQPASGCLGGTTLGAIDALVTWDGEWLAQTTYAGWDERIAADPRLFDALSPWAYLPRHKDLKVVMLSEAKPNADLDLDRPLPDEAAMDAFFGPRDPSGALRAQLEANGALADGVLDALESQQLLFSVLEEQGNPVTLDLMPDTNHTSIGTAGWPVFLAAFQRAAARD